jgi:cobalt-zinc-cadmium efflux system protein
VTTAVSIGTDVDRDQRGRLRIVLGLNALLLSGTMLAWALSGSVLVLMAGADYLADTVALVLSLVAINVRARRGGGTRASLRRLAVGAADFSPVPVIVATGIGAVVMAAAALVIGRDHAHDLHIRSVLLDTVADAASSAAAFVVGLIVLVTGRLAWLDPAVAALVAVGVGISAARLLRDVRREFRRTRA